MESIGERNNQAYKPFVFSEVKFGTSGWNTCKLEHPERRSGHRTVCDDSNLYSFGGYLRTTDYFNRNEQHQLFEELWCFNFAESSWKLLPTTGDIPKELASHCAVLYGNFLHVFGGTGVRFGESTSDKLSRCDLRSLKWDEVTTTGETPVPQYGQAIVLDEKKKQLYIIGGTTGHEYSMDIHKLDLKTKHWEMLYTSKGDQPTEPKPRYRHEVAFDGNNIYIFGGGTAVSAFSLKIVPTFNLHTQTWTLLKTKPSDIYLEESDSDLASRGFPARRKCHTLVQLNDDVYISGGCNASKVYNDLWKFHLPTRQWHFIPVTIPVPLSFHTASLTPAGCMYLFGGVVDYDKNERTNQVFKIWLTVPSLKEICWEAVTSNKYIRQSSRQSLLEAGVPADHVRRLHPSPPGGKADPSVESIWDSDILKMKNSCVAQSPSGCVNSFV